MTTAVEGKLGRRLGLKMYWMPVRSDNPNCLIKNGPHPLLMTIPSKYCQTFNRGILMRCCLRLLNDLTTKALADRGSQEAYGKFCLIRPRVSLWSKPMLKCESEAKPCPIKKEKGKKKKNSPCIALSLVSLFVRVLCSARDFRCVNECGMLGDRKPWPGIHVTPACGILSISRSGLFLWQAVVSLWFRFSAVVVPLSINIAIWDRHYTWNTCFFYWTTLMVHLKYM